jgi:hypothetical protein
MSSDTTNRNGSTGAGASPIHGLDIIDPSSVKRARIAPTSFTITATADDMVRIKAGDDGELLELRLGGLADPFGRVVPVPVKLKGRNAYVFADEVKEGSLVVVTGRIESWKPHENWIPSLIMGDTGPDGGNPWKVLTAGEPEGDAMVRGRIAGCSRPQSRGSKWFHNLYLAIKQGQEEAKVPVRVWNLEGEEFLGQVRMGMPVEIHGTPSGGAGAAEGEPPSYFAHVNVKTQAEGGYKVLTEDEYTALVEPADGENAAGSGEKATADAKPSAGAATGGQDDDIDL